MSHHEYRFTAGPWNIHSGADPFGPPVRQEIPFADKVKRLHEIGYHGVQFHDDDIVEAEADWTTAERTAREVKKLLEEHGLVAEFVAPRLWEDPRTIDGAVTSNDPDCRRYALDRSKRCLDLARVIGTNKIVLWPAREGTYLREAKDAKLAVERMTEYINALLDHDPECLILGEMKPNEPMDQAYFPTVGHFIGLAYRTKDPDRVGALIESAHAILAGLDPSDEMGYALAHGKLWGVHLNDQNGLKFDEDKSFGSVDLRRAFNQVRILDENEYGTNGEMVGFDVKALRTQKDEVCYRHLENSRRTFLRLLEVVRSVDAGRLERLRAERDYEALDQYILDKLMGIE